MKICICDDEKNIHTIIKKYISNTQTTNSQAIIFDAFSAEELITLSEKFESFDIIFLDIEMDGLSGIDAAKQIRQNNKDAIIIFVSNFPNYVFETFKVEALHFLVKPISEDEFINVFRRAIHKYTSINTSISLKWQSERYIIKINSIKYVEGYKRHITIYTTEGEYEAIGKIPQIFEKLEPHGFIRTHQGFIVNMDHIKRFDLTDVVLFDGTKVMISVRKRAEALQAFDVYLKKRKW